MKAPCTFATVTWIVEDPPCRRCGADASVGWRSKHVVVVVAHGMTMVLSTSTDSGFYASWASVMYKMSRYIGIHAI